MGLRARTVAGLGVIVCLTLSLSAPDRPLADQPLERAYGSVALVLAGRTPGQPPDTIGEAVVVRQNGVLLTAYHLVKDAYSLQVRFKSGEVFDQVQSLGVDTRRDVAAIKVIARALPVLPIAIAGQAKIGDVVSVLSHPAALEWSASSGVN